MNARSFHDTGFEQVHCPACEVTEVESEGQRFRSDPALPFLIHALEGDQRCTDAV